MKRARILSKAVMWIGVLVASEIVVPCIPYKVVHNLSEVQSEKAYTVQKHPNLN